MCMGFLILDFPNGLNLKNPQLGFPYPMGSFLAKRNTAKILLSANDSPKYSLAEQAPPPPYLIQDKYNNF